MLRGIIVYQGYYNQQITKELIFWGFLCRITCVIDVLDRSIQFFLPMMYVMYSVDLCELPPIH